MGGVEVASLLLLPCEDIDGVRVRGGVSDMPLQVVEEVLLEPTDPDVD